MHQTIFNYFILAILGMLPSLIWLFFYLKEDARPEPNSTIIAVFLLGMLSIVAAAILQLSILWAQNSPKSIAELLDITSQKPLHKTMWLNLIIFAPITEEFLKYLVVKIKVLKNAALDEPLDIMLYMVIAGLGFAAAENIFYLVKSDNYAFDLIGRFITATLLHTLAAAYLGYFLAISIHKKRLKKTLYLAGFAVAFLMHGVYNFLIVAHDKISLLLLAVAQNVSQSTQDIFATGVIIIFLAANAIIVIAMFHNLKKYSGDCKI